MISLDLTSEEEEALIELLECVLADLHLEMQSSEGIEFKRLMHDRAEVVGKVIASLREGGPVEQPGKTARGVVHRSQSRVQKNGGA